MASCRAGPGPGVLGCARLTSLCLLTALTDFILTRFHNPGTRTDPPGSSRGCDDAATTMQTARLTCRAVWSWKGGGWQTVSYESTITCISRLWATISNSN